MLAERLQSPSHDQPHQHQRRHEKRIALWDSHLHHPRSEWLLPGAKPPHWWTRKWLLQHRRNWRLLHLRNSSVQECMPKFLLLLKGRYQQPTCGVRLQSWQRLRSCVLPMKRGIMSYRLASHTISMKWAGWFFKEINIVRECTRDF